MGTKGWTDETYEKLRAKAKARGNNGARGPVVQTDAARLRISLALRRPLEEALKSGFRKGARLKRRLIAEGLKEDRCEICGLGPEWNGQPLSLQLDHINGDARDNRLENLRVVCPNCHSQTPTFCRKNGLGYNSSRKRLHKGIDTRSRLQR